MEVRGDGVMVTWDSHRPTRISILLDMFGRFLAAEEKGLFTVLVSVFAHSYSPRASMLILPVWHSCTPIHNVHVTLT